MNALRFCMITTFYPPYNFGGDGIGVQRLSQALVRRGHQVTVVHNASAYHLLSNGVAPEPPQPDGVEVVSLEHRLGRAAALLDHQSGRPLVHGRRLKRLLESGGYDVINFHNISLAGGPGVLGLGNAIKLYMAHEHWLICPSHVLWRHGREVCTGRECLRCVLHYRRPPQMWRYTGFLERQLSYVDTFIAMSEFSRAKHREFGFPRPMEVLPYFLPDETQPDSIDDHPSPYERPYFLFVGRLERIKGVEDVIPIFADYGDADFVIAGDGEHRAVLESLAAENPRIHFLGRVPTDELQRYYRHAIALIVPSVCYETFGIILIEAFRAGVPVIARRIGPFPELIDRSGAGLLFDDPEQLRTALARVQHDMDGRARLASAGLRAFERYWSEEAVMPQYLDIVKRAAQRRGNHHVAAAVAAEGSA